MMGVNSNIEWTNHTWNPWYGCTKVSLGCVHCYMHREMRRYGKDPATVQRSRSTFAKPLSLAQQYPGTRVFACSWSDFFHPAADPWRADAWDIIRQTPQLHYLILTKRPELIAARLPADWGDGWPHVWLGASIESQFTAKMRLRELIKTPSVHRFLSLEPLLDPVDLVAAAPAVDDSWVWDEVNSVTDDEEPEELIEECEAECDWINYGNDLVTNPEYREYLSWRKYLAGHVYLQHTIDWVIAGGETGPGARPCHPDWVRELRDFCHPQAVSSVRFILKDVPFFFKGWGDNLPLEADPALAADGRGISVEFQPVGKRQAGRLIDGREWLELPEEFQR